MTRDELMQVLSLFKGSDNATHIHLENLENMTLRLPDSTLEALKPQPPPAPVIHYTPPAIVLPAQKQADFLPVAEALGQAIGDLADGLRNQPAPQVTVDAPVTVVMPRIAAEHDTILRNAAGDMTGVDKQYEYEGDEGTS